jgi:GNAT superfamily N-acetyltransferase
MATMENLKKVPFNIRSAAVDDIPFVFNSWLKSYRDAPAVRAVPNTTYYAEHHAIIEKIFSSAGLVLLVACDATESKQIFGYAVGERTSKGFAIHWVYVKFPFRRFRIGAALEQALLATNVDLSEVCYTHAPKGGEGLFRTRKYTYNPYLLIKA